MPRTRLFHTLIICGAALTGGSATIVVTAASVAGCGCDDTAMTIIDASVPHDMAVHDLRYTYDLPHID